MSAPRQRIQPLRNPVLPGSTTPEQRYWRGFQNPLIVKEHAAISHIHFSPVGSHDFAVTSSAQVQIFSGKTRQVARTINRFKDTVYSGEFRSDGKLLVAGDATGLIQIFDAHSRAILVTLSPTQHPTHVTKFHPRSLTSLLSASDDRGLRIWDITAPDPIYTFTDHEDYIRSATFLGPTSNLVASGCYDGLVRVYDPRTESSSSSLAAKFSQLAPVEDVIALSPTTLVSCGGPSVKVWDLVAGKMVKDLGNFQKTVTCLWNAGERGILAGSLDGHVKAFSNGGTGGAAVSADGDLQVRYGWKFGGGILSCAVSPNYKHFVAGLTSGLLSIRTRRTEPRVAQGVKQEKSSNFARMVRGADYRGDIVSEVISESSNTPRRSNKKLRAYERHLAAFRWGDALDSALVPGVAPELVITVLTELKDRGKVRVALANRDEASLEPILRWSLKAIENARNVDLLADWIGCIVDMYGGSITDKSPLLEDLLAQIHRRVDGLVVEAKEAREIEGMLEMVSSAAATTTNV